MIYFVKPDDEKKHFSLVNLIKRVFNLFDLEMVNLKLHHDFVNKYHAITNERNEIKDGLNRLNYLFEKGLVLNDPDLGNSAFIKYIIINLGYSKGQLFQYLFVLYCLHGKTDGYFVEFGAANRISLSNTWLLEKKYNWRGIVAEPAITWHEKLRANRCCVIDTRCVWTKSGEKLTFIEANQAELSTIGSFLNADYHQEEKKK